MDKYKLLKCHKILKKIMERPIVQPFLQILQTDFKSIQMNIFTNSYPDFNMFDQDMVSLLNSTLITYAESCDDDNLKQCAQELYNYYRKKIRKLNPSFNPKSPLKQQKPETLKSLNYKLSKALDNTPDIIIEFKERMYHNQSEPFYRNLTPEELESLGKAIHNCKNVRIMNGVKVLFQTLGDPKLNLMNQNLHIELNKCSNQCLIVIRDYLKEQLAIEGIDYNKISQ